MSRPPIPEIAVERQITRSLDSTSGGFSCRANVAAGRYDRFLSLGPCNHTPWIHRLELIEKGAAARYSGREIDRRSARTARFGAVAAAGTSATTVMRSSRYVCPNDGNDLPHSQP